MATTVTTFAELQAALLAADQAAANTGLIEITISGTIAETADPTAINLKAGNTLLIKGVNGGTLNGQDPADATGNTYHRGLFVYQGDVTIQDLTIENARAVGGAGGDAIVGNAYAGGGGGAGLGGGLFVAGTGTRGAGTGGHVTLVNVTFDQNQAIGGAGGGAGSGQGAFVAGGGGLGGAGGAGGGVFGGGGGIGGAANGGGRNSSPGTGIVPVSNGASPNNGGGGGSGSGGGISASDSDGGYGGGGSYQGDGGFGGGGGGTDFRENSGRFPGGGDGGFGGGGGGSVDFSGRTIPTAGGFGGGAGGLSSDGQNGSTASGGGGLGAGGDIFVQQGGTLTIRGTATLSNGQVTAGAGGPNTSGAASGTAGQAFASGIYLQGSNKLIFDTEDASGKATTQAVGDVIGDDTGSAAAAGYAGAPAYGGKPGYTQGTIGVAKTGTGTLTLSAANTYAGGSTINDGTLALTTAGAGGSGNITFDANVDGFSVLHLSGTAEPSSGGVFSNDLIDFGFGDALNLKNIQYREDSFVSKIFTGVNGFPAVFSGEILVSSGGREEYYRVGGSVADAYATANDGSGGTLVGIATTGQISVTDGTTYDASSATPEQLVVYGGTRLSYTAFAATGADGHVRLTVGNGRISEVIDLGTGPHALGLDFSDNIAAVSLLGGADGDSLEGGAGGDRLDGGAGVDTLAGGAGNDTYIVDDAGDVVVEADASGVDNGRDTILTSLSWTLTKGQSIETLRLLNATTDQDLNLTGNEIANTLIGNAGDNVLDGGAGADTMAGGKGDDTYHIDDALDRVVEINGNGVDKAITTVSYSLNNTSYVETLQADTGAGDIGLTGNKFGNILIGNDGDNRINGRAGGDVMEGGAGDDIYTVDNFFDKITESKNASGGNDTVISTADFFFLGEGVGIEKLQIASSVFAKGLSLLIGNELDQRLIGNGEANGLDGGLGNDVLQGLGGSDIFAFSTTLGSNNIDHIRDFNAGQDQILLAPNIFSEVTMDETGRLDANAFVDIGVKGNTVDGDDSIAYNSKTGALFYVTHDGSGAHLQQFAVLDTHPALTNLNFGVPFME